MDESVIQKLLVHAFISLFQDREGIYVEVDGSRYVLYKNMDEFPEKVLRVLDASDEPEFCDGRLIWYHDENEKVQ
jgi:hypothetical protein